MCLLDQKAVLSLSKVDGKVRTKRRERILALGRSSSLLSLETPRPVSLSSVVGTDSLSGLRNEGVSKKVKNFGVRHLV